MGWLHKMQENVELMNLRTVEQLGSMRINVQRKDTMKMNTLKVFEE